MSHGADDEDVPVSQARCCGEVQLRRIRGKCTPRNPRGAHIAAIGMRGSSCGQALLAVEKPAARTELIIETRLSSIRALRIPGSVMEASVGTMTTSHRAGAMSSQAIVSFGWTTCHTCLTMTPGTCGLRTSRKS